MFCAEVDREHLFLLVQSSIHTKENAKFYVFRSLNAVHSS